MVKSNFSFPVIIVTLFSNTALKIECKIQTFKKNTLKTSTNKINTSVVYGINNIKLPTKY